METNESLDYIRPFCFYDTEKFDEESLNQLFMQIDKIPRTIANSTDTFLNKLIKLKQIGLFTTLNLILDNKISSTMQIKLLKFWDFLITTSSSPDELAILFSNDTINKLIFYSFDVSSIEILQSYITVLKEISLKVKYIDAKNLFTLSVPSQNSENKYAINECPLYSHSIKYINNSDSVVVSAARLVVLNLCLVKYPPLQAYLSENSMLNPFEQLINNIGPDEFAFLVDFLNVAPLNLREFILHKLRSKFAKCSLHLLCYGTTFLKDTPARPMLIDTLSERIFSFPVADKLLLGILLFSLENKLILLDSAIKYGLITQPDIATFSKKPAQYQNSINFRNEIKSVLENPLRTSVPIITFSLALRCLEVIYSSPPRSVIEANLSIIREVKSIDPSRAMQIFLHPPCVSRRFDIPYLLEHVNDIDKIDVDEKVIFQLFEVQASICRWRKTKRFTWFSFSFDRIDANNPGNNNDLNDLAKKDDENEKDLDNANSGSSVNVKINRNKNGSLRYPTSDGNFVSLSPSELIISNGHSFQTNSIYMDRKKGGKMRKFVDIMTVEQLKRSKSNLFPNNGSNPYLHHIEFASVNVTNSFESELTKIQKNLIDKMIEGLET